MNLRKRVTKAEKLIIPLDDDGPVSVVELFSGVRDYEYRRRIGPARVREDAKKIRELVERVANDDPSLDVLEGDDRSDLEPPSQSSENRSSAIEYGDSKNLGDIRE